MSTTYTWSVTQMTCYPQYEGQTDVVFQVRWMCKASSDATPIPTEAIEDAVTSLKLDSGSPFTPYNQLTEQQVLGWVFDALTPQGVALIEEGLDKEIALKLSPPVVNPPSPWSQA